MDFGELSKRPLKLKRNRVRRPFKGGLLLDKWQGAEMPVDGYAPEEWVASAVRAVNPDPVENEGLSKVNIAGDPLLKDLIEGLPEDFLGYEHTKRHGNNMGVLVKVLDSCSRLLIQVHPDKNFARKMFKSDYGKTEAWYIIGCRKINNEEPYVLFGFKPGITRKKWVELFEKQDIKGMEHALHKFIVKPGDVFFVEGGIPHAAGPGVFFMEIQEPTDITIRIEKKNLAGQSLDDFQVHQGIGFDRMFDCFHYDGYTRKEIIDKWKLRPAVAREEFGGRELDILPQSYTPYFSMKRLDVENEFAYTSCDTFSIAVVVAGEGKLVWDAGEMEISQSDELFIPSAVGKLTWKTMGNNSLDVVICYPPVDYRIIN